MLLGLSAFTWFHTLLSLVALVAGVVVTIGLLGARTLPSWSALYLATAVATSVTGFGFPFDHFMASHWVGVLSLVVLAAAIIARYVFRYAGAWRWIYTLGTIIGFYFLVFVAIAQAFQKIPALASIAPTLSETPFAAEQIVALVVFIGLAIAAIRTFRPGTEASPLL